MEAIATLKERLKTWADSYREDLVGTDEPIVIRIRYGLGHHYRDWFDDRHDAKHRR